MGYNYTDYPIECVLLFGVTWCYNYLMRISFFSKKNHLCSIKSEQPIELSLVKLNTCVRHYCVTHTNWGDQCNFNHYMEAFSSRNLYCKNTFIDSCRASQF